MPENDVYRAAERMVRSLGVTCANASVCQFVRALELLHRNGALIHSMGRLDEQVAEYYDGLTWKNIERNLREARDIILKRGDPERLREVVGFPLRRRPSVANFLDAILFYMDCEGLWPD